MNPLAKVFAYFGRNEFCTPEVAFATVKGSVRVEIGPKGKIRLSKLIAMHKGP